MVPLVLLSGVKSRNVVLISFGDWGSTFMCLKLPALSKQPTSAANVVVKITGKSQLDTTADIAMTAFVEAVSAHDLNSQFSTVMSQIPRRDDILLPNVISKSDTAMAKRTTQIDGMTRNTSGKQSSTTANDIERFIAAKAAYN
ncbi:hypothetical protein T09_3350 [Trichinella sp. T9]|nr:hypothetical protein T09_3350 [Trichinella sp. T9]